MAVLLTACETPSTPKVKSAQRIAIGCSVPVGVCTHAHQGTTMLTNSIRKEPAPGLDVSAMFQSAVGDGRSFTRIAMKSPSGGRVSPELGCDIQVMLHENNGMSKLPNGACVRQTRNTLGLKSDRGMCQLQAEVYVGDTGELIASAISVTESDPGLVGIPAVLNAAQNAVHNLAVSLGLKRGAMKADARHDGFLLLDKLDQKINALPSSVPEETKEQLTAERKQIYADFKAAVSKPIPPPLQKTRASLDTLQKKMSDINKRNWQQVKAAAQDTFGTSRPPTQ